MDDFQTRRAAPTDRRIAFWATLMAAVAMIAGVASAEASSGGTGIGGSGASGGVGGTTTGSGGSAETTPVTPGCPNTQLGRRTLKVGDCGGDVATLNWILKAKNFGQPTLVDEFEDATKTAVEAFQAAAKLESDGIVDTETSAALVNAMPAQLATWYGPGFFGNQTASGQTLTRQTLGVAHKTLPCGSKVVLHYNGRFIRTTVIDRGPYANGAKWDLTQATAQALRFEYTDEVRVAKIAGRSTK
jgi:peptidoglycan hydrolase-like protein with peptidoglycan-binding domain